MHLRLRDYKVILKRFAEIEQLRRLGVDNPLKVKYSMPILKKYGQIYEVHPPPKKSLRMKAQTCYANAESKRDKGFNYVEGIITSKKSGLQISHAWNVDSNGRHVDFTVMDTGNYEYLGIVLPWPVLSEVAFSTARMWYTVLPYLTYGR